MGAKPAKNREVVIRQIEPPVPQRHAWFKNPALHQYEDAGGICTLCGIMQDRHCYPGECQSARRERLGL